MTQEAAGATVPPGPEASPSTESTIEGGNTSQDDPYESKFSEQNERIDLLGDRFEALNETITQHFSARPAAAQEPDDEEEGLTERKVQKIVSGALQNHGAAMNNNAQRLSWDDKAKTDFRLEDPKFEREFRKTWKEKVTNGSVDANHAKAVYDVAELTAMRLGVSKKTARTRTTSNESETGLSPTPAPPKNPDNKSSISDSHPQVKFYKLKGNKTPEQIEGFKKDLQVRIERQGQRA